jgi:hypothetical protein
MGWAGGRIGWEAYVIAAGALWQLYVAITAPEKGVLERTTSGLFGLAVLLSVLGQVVRGLPGWAIWIDLPLFLSAFACGAVLLVNYLRPEREDPDLDRSASASGDK